MDAAWEEALRVCKKTINEGEGAEQASIWTTIIAAFDPREPWAAPERDQPFVREALASLRYSQERLAAWYVDAYMSAFHQLCMEVLAPLISDEHATAHLPFAVDTCFEWIVSRQTLALEAGILPHDTCTAILFSHCKTVISAAMQPGMHKVIENYFQSALHVEESTNVVPDSTCAQVCTQLRILGLDAAVQSAITETASHILEHATQQAVTRSGSLQEAVYPALHALLCDELMPALSSMLNARPKEPVSMSPTLYNAWDISVSMMYDDTPELDEDHESLYLRLEYSLAKMVGKHRLTQLYALVGMFPQSRAAMEDMVMWLAKTDERIELAHSFTQALQTRLLHPDMDTHAILAYYINIVFALRMVDTSGVVLSRVLPPVQHYLRTRHDTIRVIVHALLGDDAEFELLRSELVQLQPENDAPSSAWDMDAEDEQYTRLEHWVDPTWAPRPVDAGPAFRLMRSNDVVGLLAQIFHDRQGFLHALEQHTAQRLVRTVDYDTSRVQHNIAIFKRRLGEQSLHHCDVMLADVATSRALDSAFHTQENVAEYVHPMVVSRQFWPDLDTRTWTWPTRLAQSLQQFSAFYTRQNPTKCVRWLPHLGTVDVDIELRNNECVSMRVSPLQLAVLELVTENEAPGVVTAEDLARVLELQHAALALEALRFWVAQGVLREWPSAGSFELCDNLPVSHA